MAILKTSVAQTAAMRKKKTKTSSPALPNMQILHSCTKSDKKQSSITTYKEKNIHLKATSSSSALTP